MIIVKTKARQSPRRAIMSVYLTWDRISGPLDQNPSFVTLTVLKQTVYCSRIGLRMFLHGGKAVL